MIRRKNNDNTFGKKKKSYFFLLIKFIISFLILYLISTKVDLSLVLSLFSKVSMWQVLFLVFLNFLSFFIMVLKWDILLKRFSKINLFKLLKLYLASDFINLFFFGVIGGEAYKAYYTKDRKATIFTSLFDRIYSFFLYFLIFGFILSIWFFSNFIIEFGFLFFVLFALFISYYQLIYQFLIDRYSFFSFLKYGFLSVKQMWLHFFYSFFYLLTISFRFWFCFYVFGYKPDFILMIALSSIVIVAISLPISVQGLGVREFVLILFSSYFLGIPTQVALAVSLLFYVTNIIYRLFGVIPFLLEKGVSR